MTTRRPALIAAALLLTAAPVALAQSSSLYVEPTPHHHGGFHGQPQPSRLAPALSGSSFTLVRQPEPRQFGVHDLVTIIIREASEAQSSARLATEKDSRFNHRLAAFPDLQKLLEFSLAPGNIATNPVSVDLRMNQDWEGEGRYRRSDSVTSRVTARIIDVKPNGLLVLEARKFIKNDNEELDLVLTGTCRAEDVAADNTILSTQLYDLRLAKEHKGELRRATRKGLITRVMEVLFNF
jgi:flagellar L-ring protein precursor FlgH